MDGRASRPNASLFQHACTAIQPSCNQHKAGAVQERRSRQELAAACREGWDESVGWRRLGARMVGRHIKPQPLVPVWRRPPCRLPRWLSNPSASHRIARTPTNPRPNELSVAHQSLASFALCGCGKLGVSTRPDLSTAASSTPPSHQRQRHLISHHIRLAESSPFSRLDFWRREVGLGRVTLVGGFSNQCICFPEGRTGVFT